MLRRINYVYTPVLRFWPVTTTDSKNLFFFFFFYNTPESELFYCYYHCYFLYLKRKFVDQIKKQNIFQLPKKNCCLFFIAFFSTILKKAIFAMLLFLRSSKKGKSKNTCWSSGRKWKNNESTVRWSFFCFWSLSWKMFKFQISILRKTLLLPSFFPLPPAFKLLSPASVCIFYRSFTVIRWNWTCADSEEMIKFCKERRRKKQK